MPETPPLMGQPGAAPSAPGGAPPGSPSPAPAAAPLSAPAPAAGQQAKGRLRLQIIAKLLNETIGMLVMGSDEWKDAMGMLKLAGPYGGGASDSPLQQTEMKSLGQNAPQLPAISPAQRQAFANLIRQKSGQPAPADAPPAGV